MLSDFLFYKAIFPASGESGGGSGNGATVLKRHGYDENDVIPAGTFGQLALYRLWDDTPTFSSLVGSVLISKVKHITNLVIDEESLLDASSEGIPIILHTDGTDAYMAFITEDFSAEGMDFKAGIYVCDYFVTTQDVVNYFAYNLDPPKGA